MQTRVYKPIMNMRIGILGIVAFLLTACSAFLSEQSPPTLEEQRVAEVIPSNTSTVVATLTSTPQPAITLLASATPTIGATQTTPATPTQPASLTSTIAPTAWSAPSADVCNHVVEIPTQECEALAALYIHNAGEDWFFSQSASPRWMAENNNALFLAWHSMRIWACCDSFTSS